MGNRALAAALGAVFATGLMTSPVAAARGGPGPDAMVKVIVTFREPVGRADRLLVKAAGGQVDRTFRLIPSVAARVPSHALDGLRRNPNVRSVEIDHTITTFHHAPATANAELEAAWGVEHIGAGAVHADGNTGQGVKVGVIDTGIEYAHPDLNSVYAGGWDFYNNDADPFDDNGHGTHVSGSLAAELNSPAAGVVGVAPDVDLYAYKVLGATGSGDYSGLIAALERATLVDHVDVVNMSLGAHTPSDALAAAVTAAYATGTVLVAASGNVDPTNISELFFGCAVAYPAAYPEVFATTYTGQNNELTGFSCTGPEVDFASPGDLINSTVPTGACMFCAPSGYRNDMSGTSMASPHLAGTVALVLSHGITNEGDPVTLADDVKGHVCANASLGFGVLSTPIPANDPRYPKYFGCGVTDAFGALLTNPPPTDEPPPPENQPPNATDDSATTAQGTPVTVAVLANDTDPDNDPLSVSAVTLPSHGATSISAGSVLYTPVAGYVGPDSFDYTVADGHGGTDTATVNVTVTVPPGPTMHVGDLDALATLGATKWSAKVTVRVHSAAHGNVGGVIVTGQWSTGQVVACTTGSGGKCNVSRTGIGMTRLSVTFTVTSLTKSGRTYVPSANHDPEADSNGTSIVVLRP